MPECLWALQGQQSWGTCEEPTCRWEPAAAHCLTRTTRTPSARPPTASPHGFQNVAGTVRSSQQFGGHLVGKQSHHCGNSRSPRSLFSRWYIPLEPMQKGGAQKSMSRTQQCYPLTENVFSVLFIETTHQKSISCLPAKHGDQIKH